MYMMTYGLMADSFLFKQKPLPYNIALLLIDRTEWCSGGWFLHEIKAFTTQYIQSVSESWVCHFAVDAEMVSKNQFYHMVRDWFGVKNWPLVAKFLKVATFIEGKLSKKGFGIFSFFSKSFGEKTWNQNSGASFGMTLLFCFQNFVLWSTLKKKFRHRKFKVK